MRITAENPLGDYAFRMDTHTAQILELQKSRNRMAVLALSMVACVTFGAGLATGSLLFNTRVEEKLVFIEDGERLEGLQASLARIDYGAGR